MSSVNLDTIPPKPASIQINEKKFKHLKAAFAKAKAAFADPPIPFELPYMLQCYIAQRPKDENYHGVDTNGVASDDDVVEMGAWDKK